MRKIYTLVLILLVMSGVAFFTGSATHAAKKRSSHPTRAKDGLWIVPNVAGQKDKAGLKDFDDLFKGRGIRKWQDARNSIGVFAMYEEYWLADIGPAKTVKKDSDLRNLITLLNDWGIQIGVYTRINGVNDQNECVMKHARDTWPGYTQKALQRIKNNRGTVRYILVDSALSVGTSPPCNQSKEQVAKEFAEFGQLARTIFPQATLVDTDTFPDITIEDWKEWLEILKRHAGKYVEYISLDTNVGDARFYDDQWASTFPWNEVVEIEQYAKSLGFKVLSEQIATRLPPDRPSQKYEPYNNEEFYWYTLDRAGEYYAAGARPDADLLISWLKKPDRALPDSSGYSFMQLARDLVQMRRAYGNGTLEVIPSELTLAPDQSVKLKVLFDIDGPSGPLPKRDVTKFVTWTSDDIDVITVGNTSKDKSVGTAHQASEGPITVKARFAGYEAWATVNVVEPEEQ